MLYRLSIYYYCYSMLFLLVFYYTVGYYFADEREWKWLIERKLDGAFGGFVGLKVFFEGFYGRWCGEKADVGFEAAEVDEIAVEFEGGDAVRDGFLCLWRGFFDSLSDGLQKSLRVLWEGADVFIDGFYVCVHGLTLPF
jgi:hypothetical protein